MLSMQAWAQPARLFIKRSQMLPNILCRGHCDTMEHLGQLKTAAWTLTSSTYSSHRKRKAKSRDFGGMAPVCLKSFDVDWVRFVVKLHFVAASASSPPRR